MFDLYIKKFIKKMENQKFDIEVPVLSMIIDLKSGFYLFSNNTREMQKNIAGHAEINCINKVYKKQNYKNLSNYILITSMLPCEMCYFAMKQANLKKIYYFLNNKKNKTLELIKYKGPDLIKLENLEFENKYKNKIKTFFKTKRS